MGSFCGHAFPGSAFLLVGIWWTIQILRRHSKPVPKADPLRSPGFHSTVTFPIQIWRGKFHIEVIQVSCMTLLGILFETVIVNPSGHRGITAVNIQHATMYVAFGLAFISAVVLPKVKVFPEPDKLPYLILCLAFISEYLIFSSHRSGSGEVHQLMHTLLLYPVLGCVLTTLADMLYRKSLLLALARAYFTMLQGLWFWQVGFILYPPGSNFWGREQLVFEEEHNIVMVQTCVFTWYMMGLFVFSLVCSAGIEAYYNILETSKQPLLKKDTSTHLLPFDYAAVLNKDEEEF